MSIDPKSQSAKLESVGHFKSIAEDGQAVGGRVEEKTDGAREALALARIVEPGTVHARSLAGSPIGGSPSGLEAALVTFLQSKTSGSFVPVERRIFLTMAESADFSGLPVVFLRRLIACGKLKALKTGAGWRVPRTEIEKLSGTLMNPPEELTEHEIRDMELNRRRRREG